MSAFRGGKSCYQYNKTREQLVKIEGGISIMVVVSDTGGNIPGKTLPHRKTIRLKDYDYSQAGYYFVTICTKDRKTILCNVGAAALGCPPSPSLVPYVINLSPTGEMFLGYLQRVGINHNNVGLDSFVVMPNHIHCIIAIQDRSPTEDGGRLRAAAPTTIPRLINSFKSLTSKQYGQSLWQRGYYEHIIRNEYDLQETREYLSNNPARWIEDDYYIKAETGRHL